MTELHPAPTISLLMPVFNSMVDFGRGNGVFLLPDAIDSLLNQSYPDFEIIILDNLSDDGTFQFCEELQKRDSRVKPHRDICRRTPEESIHKLIQLATGRFSVIVNDDDLWHPEFLETLINFHLKDSYDLVYSNGEYISISGRPLGKLINREDWIYSDAESNLSNFCRYIHNRNPFPISFGIFRTSILKAHYPKNKFHKYKANTDNVFVCQLLNVTNRIAFIDKSLFFYRSKKREYFHQVEFGYDSQVSKEIEVLDLIEHQFSFSKIIAKQISNSDIDDSEKLIMQIANSNAFFNHMLRMMVWQLEKAGLTLRDFRIITRLILMLNQILSLSMINTYAKPFRFSEFIARTQNKQFTRDLQDLSDSLEQLLQASGHNVSESFLADLETSLIQLQMGLIPSQVKRLTINFQFVLNLLSKFISRKLSFKPRIIFTYFSSVKSLKFLSVSKLQ